MTDSEKNAKFLKQDIQLLRRGRGCLENMNDVSTIIDFMGWKYPESEYNTSCLLTLIQEFMPNKKGEALLAALGLLKGYDGIRSPAKRRLQYYNASESQPKEDIKSNTLYKAENVTIEKLVSKIVEAEKEDLEKIIKNAPQMLELPVPRYHKTMLDNAVVENNGFGDGHTYYENKDIFTKCLEELMLDGTFIKLWNNFNHNDMDSSISESSFTDNIFRNVSERNKINKRHNTKTAPEELKVPILNAVIVGGTATELMKRIKRSCGQGENPNCALIPKPPTLRSIANQVLKIHR